MEQYFTYTDGTEDMTVTGWDGTDFTSEKSSESPTPIYLDDVIDEFETKQLLAKVEESHPNSQPTPRPR